MMLDNKFIYGIANYANGAHCEGNFKDGNWNGKGCYTWNGGSISIGDGENELMNGQGVH